MKNFKQFINEDKEKNSEQTKKISKNYDKKEIELGKKVELEHIPTFKKIKDFVEKNEGKFPEDDQIAEWIACNHLDEIGDYYTRLLKMEKDFKKKND